MKENFEELIALIRRWKEFKESFPDKGIQAFGRWLSTSENEAGNSEETSRFIRKETKGMKERKSVPNLANRAIIGSMIGRMMYFVKNYTKVPFQELGLGSMDEFKILSLIGRLKNPSKSMLSQAALMEFTTINDMLKRMEKRGWIIQVKDKNDKRASQIRLTEEGSVFLKKTYQTMANIEPSITGDLSEKEQEQLMEFLVRLNEFHTHYYEYHFTKKESRKN